MEPERTNWTTVGDKEFPWQCYLSDKDGQITCGCTIISQKLVLTTVRCTEGKNNADMFVNVGAHQQFIGPNPNQMPVEEIHAHPSFDMAIVELATSMTFSDVVSP